jgi:DNA-damage-inducible protein D
MTQLDLTGNPFDHIRHTDSTGEFWSARELMSLLGYERWERFEDAIERARAAAVNARVAGDHFRGAEKVIEGGRWGTQTVSDYLVTRYGAYLIAMNGDPRKERIAEAQTYFAVKTREAEVVATPALDELEVARRYVRAIEDKRAAEARVAELEPAAHSWTTLATGHGDYSVADAAKVLSRDPAIQVGQGRLFTLLREFGWIYRAGDQRWRVYQSAVDAGRLSELATSHYHPRTGELVIDPPQVRVTVKGLGALHRKLAGVSPLAITQSPAPADVVAAGAGQRAHPPGTGG